MKPLCAVATALTFAGTVAGIAVALPGAAFGQNSTLTINGTTASDNSSTVDVPAGTTMTVTIANATLAGRPYGLFAATANNAAGTGWFLDENGGTSKKPFPVVTGVATSIVEADYPPLDVSPDRSANPRMRLDITGNVTLNLKVPSTASGTIYLQAVALESSGTSTDFSNAIEVNFVAPGTAARAVVSQSATSANAVQFGVLEFTGGDVNGATFSAVSGLSNIIPDGISMADINEWATHQTGTTADKAREVDWRSATFGPALNNDHHDYPRIQLPAAAGGVPARQLLRCFDNVTGEGFFLVVNQGANPNTPGTDVFAIAGTRKQDVSATTTNQWKGSILVSPDGTVAAGIYDDTASDPKIFIFTTDGSQPWNTGGGPTGFVEVTPAGTKNFSQANTLRAGVFSDNFLWFTVDFGTTADADGRNDQRVYGVNIRSVNPIPVQVTINPSNGYSTSSTTNNAVVDTVADRSFLRPSEDASLVCFLAGDTFAATSGQTPDNIQKGDWYCVYESAPTAAVNLTKFRLYPPNTGTAPKMAVPGEAYNGVNGQATLSPDGGMLAFVAIHSEENGTTGGEDDEVYCCVTSDADGNLEGDGSGDTLFVDGQVTINSRIASASLTNTLDDAVDLYLADADNLYFFYGQDTSATDRTMDLFHWHSPSGVLTNITRPTLVAPFTTAGTVLPEGFFHSPNGRYLYFARALTAASTKTTLVGVDTVTKKAFNITGNEFSGGTTSDTFNPSGVGDNFSWHLSYFGGLYPSLCVFSAATTAASTASQHIWLFDANYPTAAIQITAETPGVAQNVESLNGSPVSLGMSWAWTRPTSNLADFQYQDLLFFFRDTLSDTASTFTSSVTLSAFDWVRAATSSDSGGAAPPALIVAIGDNGTDSASDAEFYYFSLDGSSNYDFDDGTHEMGTTALSGGRFTGFLQIYHVDVE
ncbi:MAG: hypothetical protein JNL90_06790 [Planctomycetes bacterium]|nr:hypothetical protein [Planctomycetota bacterium]